MFSFGHGRWCIAAAFLYSWALLRCCVEARPFVLLSGLEALPDDDIEPEYPVAAHYSQPMSARLFHPPASESPAVAAARYARQFAPRQIAGMVGGSDRLPTLARPVSRQPALEASTINRVALPRPEPKCRDARQDVVIESGLQGHADVFSQGRAAAQWAPSLPGSASISNFVLPTEEQVAVFVVHTGQGTSVVQPQVGVSDASVLGVELAEKYSARAAAAGPDAEPVVFLSKHFCKREGVATVTIALPIQRKSGLCAGLFPPVVFSYRKACPAASHTVANFEKALAVPLPEKDKQMVAIRHEQAINPPERPFKILPSGGGRFVLGFGLVLLIVILAYEFFSFWLSNKIKEQVLGMCPEVFGCDGEVGHTAINFWLGHMTFTMQGFTLKNPPGDYHEPYLMKIDEVKLWFDMNKIVGTLGRDIVIRQLICRHIQANIESDGLVFGETNVAKVLACMEKNNKEFEANLERIKNTHGIDAESHFNAIMDKVNKIMDRVTMKEVHMESIGYSHPVIGKALRAEMNLADMRWDNFSEENKAVGVKKIGYFITHAVLEGVAEDIAGVEFGHHHFEGLVNGIKRLTGQADPE